VYVRQPGLDIPARPARDAATQRRGIRGAECRPRFGCRQDQRPGIAFEQAEVNVPAGEPVQIEFANNDPGTPHNVAIHRESATGEEVFQGETFNGVETRTYDIPAIDAGAYAFVCTVHPNMVGPMTAE
jgi:plastocyanin